MVDPIDETMYTCCNNRVHQFKWRPDHGGYVAERATPKPAPRNVTPATPEPPPEGIVFNSEARAASGAGRAILSKPLGLAMRDGVLFVASSGNNLIVVLDAVRARDPPPASTRAPLPPPPPPTRPASSAPRALNPPPRASD